MKDSTQGISFSDGNFLGALLLKEEKINENKKKSFDI